VTVCISESEVSDKLLSIYLGIDQTCRKIDSRLEPTAAGEVHFIDPDHGEYKFRTHQLSSRSELLEAIRTGWIPCGFIVVQIVGGRSELHVGNFSWMKSFDECAQKGCTRYIAKQLEEFAKRRDATEEIIRSVCGIKI
jgi:hypothetical protein